MARFINKLFSLFEINFRLKSFQPKNNFKGIYSMRKMKKQYVTDEIITLNFKEEYYLKVSLM